MQDRKHMKENYIHYPVKHIYAIYYESGKSIYYNLDFDGATKIYLFISGNTDAAFTGRKSVC